MITKNKEMILLILLLLIVVLVVTIAIIGNFRKADEVILNSNEVNPQIEDTPRKDVKDVQIDFPSPIK